MKLKSLLLALGLASATMANANTADLGDLAAATALHGVQVQTVFHTPGSFTDYYFFSLGESAIGSGTTSVIPVYGPEGPWYSFSSLSTYLYQDLGTVGTADAADTGFLMGNGNTSSHGLLTAGSYYIKIAGVANGSLGGIYTASAVAVPVPEPETYAMMVAGLGLIGGVARRRMQK